MANNSIRTAAGVSNFEDFDDEIVIIHNETGVFYLLRGCAMAIWRACLQGADTASIEQRLTQIDGRENPFFLIRPWK